MRFKRRCQSHPLWLLGLCCPLYLNPQLGPMAYNQTTNQLPRVFEKAPGLFLVCFVNSIPRAPPSKQTKNGILKTPLLIRGSWKPIPVAFLGVSHPRLALFPPSTLVPYRIIAPGSLVSSRHVQVTSPYTHRIEVIRHNNCARGARDMCARR